jgi:hypothetical protein
MNNETNNRYNVIVDFLRLCGVEVRRSNAHWALFGQGIYGAPSGAMGGDHKPSFQTDVDKAVKLGLIQQRKTSRATYLSLI